MAKPFEDFGLGPEENREFGFSQEGIYYLSVKGYPNSADAERHMAEQFETVGGDWDWRAVGEVFLSPDEPTGEAYWVESDPDQDYAIRVWRLVDVRQRLIGTEGEQELNPHYIPRNKE